MKTNKLMVAAVLVATIGAPIGLLAATGALTGYGDAVAMDKAPPVQVDVAPVLVKRIRHWDEFNGRISAVEISRNPIQGQRICDAWPIRKETRFAEAIFCLPSIRDRTRRR